MAGRGGPVNTRSSHQCMKHDERNSDSSIKTRTHRAAACSRDRSDYRSQRSLVSSYLARARITIDLSNLTDDAFAVVSGISRPTQEIHRLALTSFPGNCGRNVADESSEARGVNRHGEMLGVMLVLARARRTENGKVHRRDTCLELLRMHRVVPTRGTIIPFRIPIIRSTRVFHVPRRPHFCWKVTRVSERVNAPPVPLSSGDNARRHATRFAGHSERYILSASPGSSRERKRERERERERERGEGGDSRVTSE